MTIHTSWESTRQGGRGARIVSRYNILIEQVCAKAKTPDFRPADWGALAEVVAIDSFEREGAFRELQDWTAYVAMLSQWASATHFRSDFRRMTETPGMVFLELTEFNTNAGHATIVNSMSTYGINDEGKIDRLGIYLQRDM